MAKAPGRFHRQGPSLLEPTETFPDEAAAVDTFYEISPKHPARCVTDFAGRRDIHETDTADRYARTRPPP